MTNQEAVDFVYLVTQNNFEVMPLSGKDGKKPRVSRFKNRTIQHSQTLRLLETDEISTYGIRLKGLTVIDIDERNWEYVAEVESLLGSSSFIVETGRGYHLYYRGEYKFKNPFAFPADIKSGWNSYVVGPYSVRPDGVIYLPIRGTLINPPMTECKVPVSQLRKSCHPAHGSTQVTSNGIVPIGERHNYLFSQAWRLADECIEVDELVVKLRWQANKDCANADSISLKEIRDIASWMWDVESHGKRYGEEFSAVKIPRSVIKRLSVLSGGSDSLALYVLLASKHRHTGSNFAIDFHGMKSGQLTDLGRDRFKRARKLLLDLGLITRATNYKVGSRPYTYKFP